jgi:DNA-binding MarR family transcriptional regulator
LREAEGTANRKKPAPGDSLLDLLARATHLMETRLYKQVRRHGVPAAEWRVLAVLSDHEDIGMKELADLAMFRQSSLTKAINRMERAKLVERTPTGHRRTLVHLTNRGRRVAAPLLRLSQRHSSGIDLLLGEAKTRDLKATLASLIICLDQLRREQRPRRVAERRRPVKRKAPQERG